MYSYFEKETPEIYISHWTESDNFDSHFHNKIEIAYCVSGKQKISIDGVWYTLTAGDVALVFPNVAHELVKQDPPDTELISVISKADFFTAAYPELITKRPKCAFIEKEKLSEDVKLAFSRMLAAKFNPGALIGWTYVALSEIMNHLELVSIKTTDSFHLAPNLISYIDDNFKKPLTIKYLANEFGYSTSYITHVFYDQLKVPFRSYLAAVRSEHAATLIRSSGKNLTEIAYECGYSSTNTFCRCFKKHFSITPSEYKKLMKKDSE